MNSAPQHWL